MEEKDDWEKSKEIKAKTQETNALKLKKRIEK